ncbi:uncharacterized protein [Rutidosis leptorrhynchoides]|uniref:uncharacterized protein n=1 Tax=Rutidosis leptorrhynchoides TaxID=125765 RepID=UPI003A98EE8D
MATPTSMFVKLKTVFVVLTCIMAVTIVWSVASDLYASCFYPRAWWMKLTGTHVVVDTVFITAWFFYKESSWIKTIVYAFLITGTGSFATCGYIVIQLFKLSPEESMTDPIYYALAKKHKELKTPVTTDGSGQHKGRRPYVFLTSIVMVVALACTMLTLLISALIIDGMPFHLELRTLLTQCFITAVIDMNVHAVVFSVWIAYKESSWLSSAIWILLLVCFNSITLCVYVLRQLFKLSDSQPIYLILFNQRNRDMMMSSSDPLITKHTDNV